MWKERCTAEYLVLCTSSTGAFKQALGGLDLPPSVRCTVYLGRLQSAQRGKVHGSFLSESRDDIVPKSRWEMRAMYKGQGVHTIE